MFLASTFVLPVLAVEPNSQQETVATTDSLFDDWGDSVPEQVNPWETKGFIEFASGGFTQENVIDKTMSMNELRGRIEVGYGSENFELFSSGDLLVDGVLSEIIWDTRELNLSVSPLAQLDLKIGRQVMTWGTGDYLFLNDLFPKDWQSFFAGRDDEYLKAPSDSIRATSYISDFSIDVSYTPEFTSDNYINGERFSFFSPIGDNGLPGQIAPSDFPVEGSDEEQWSVKVATTKAGVEYALYGYKGLWTTPTGIRTSGENQGKYYFPSLRTYGASVRTPLGLGLFNAELSVYNSIEDSRGDQFNVPNDQIKLLLGYEQEIAKNLTGAVQYYVEHMQDYSRYQANTPYPEFVSEQNRQVVTTRLTYLAYQQKLVSSFFVFHSPSDNDGYFKPSIKYRYNDSWSYSAGANLFWGNKEHTFFGQHQENSNIWLRVRLNY